MLYVSFWSKLKPRTFGCIAMGSAVLLILRYILLLYSAGSGVNRVVLSEFCMRLFCFVWQKLCVCMVIFIYLLYSCFCV